MEHIGYALAALICAFILLPVWWYVMVRLTSAAWWRSRLEQMKQSFNGNNKETK